MHRRRRVAVAAVALAAAFAIAVIGARRLDPVPEGLRVQYFSNGQPGAAAELSAVDRQPSSANLFADWLGRPPQSFTAIWTGWLAAPRDGRYTLAISADQRASVEIDGVATVDNHGVPSPPIAQGTVQLQRGVHSVFIRYAHAEGGVPAIAFLWARGDAPLDVVPAWAMRPRQVAYRRIVADEVLDAGEAISFAAVLLALLCGATIVLWPAVAHARSHLVGEDAWRPLLWIIAGSLVLSLVGIGWGLPGAEWVGDELDPLQVLDAIAKRFSHGWSGIYPPVHFYVLSLAYTPALALDWLGFVGLHTTLGHAVMTISSRTVSVIMSAGTLVATFLCARRAFGRRAALFATATFALAAPFVYYAKTANVEVPYLFWLAWCLVFYLRVLDGGAPLADYAAWAATGTLAICTKDQAYAFCIAMPFVVLYEMWRANARAGAVHPLRTALTDRRIVAATLIAIAMFVLCQNILFNSSGFLDHVRWITGRKVAVYRMFEPTIGGRLGLLRLTVRLVELTWGWPIFIASSSGLLAAAMTPGLRRVAIWLLVPVASYYLGFANIVLYNYDRFVLPICLVLALFAGLAIDRLTAERASLRAWRFAGAGILLLYTLLYSSTVDALMVNDSRYGVERWLAAHVRRNDLVGMIGIPRYLPRLDGFNTIDLDRLETFTEAQPAFCVVDADYTRIEPPDSPHNQMLATLRSDRSNYRLALRARSPSPWPWLPGAHRDLVGDRLDRVPLSFLRNINPTIEVFERR